MELGIAKFWQIKIIDISQYCLTIRVIIFADKYNDEFINPI